MSNVKFGLNYKLIYETKNEKGETQQKVEIFNEDGDFGLTCDFEIKRSYQSQLNKSYFRIYNLSPSTRSKMARDRYDALNYSKIEFYLGYGKQLYLVFSGNALITESKYLNQTDAITTIEALDGSFLTYNSYSNFSVNENTTYQYIFDKFVKDLKNKASEVKDNFSMELLTADAKTELKNKRIAKKMTFAGNTWEEMKKLFGEGLFIDNNKINYLPLKAKNNKAVFVASAETGLLNIPQLSNAILTLDMICEPSVQVGDMAEIRTTRENRFANKQYKIFGISHAGTISKTVGTEATTTLDLGRFNIT